MAMTEEQRRRGVQQVLSHLPDGWDVRRLRLEAGLDEKTTRTFLDASRWPRPATRERIERAVGIPVGSIEAAALGWLEQPQDVDPVESAIRASRLNRSNANKLVGTYYELLDGQPEVGETG